MKGKYSNPLLYAVAKAYRSWIRWRVSDLVDWEPADGLEPGCTAIIGMCSRMPMVLLGNLACLREFAWPELREIIVVADTVAGGLPTGLEDSARSVCDGVPLRLLYYQDWQSARADRLRLPYVYSWLSWCIGLSACRTRTALLHDYDALILSPRLGERHREFEESDALIQGIRWYHDSGVEPSDRLATTFEAFLDVAWLRRFRPVRLFNELRVRGGQSRDYDTLLDIQHCDTPEHLRTVAPMTKDDLIHPSQMIHQHTMFRRYPGGDLLCFSIAMIPFFESLTLGEAPILRALAQLEARKGSRTLRFLSDDLLVNFGRLTEHQVHWNLIQMVQVCVLRNLRPSAALYRYAMALYDLAETPPEQAWNSDFSAEQRAWINASRDLALRGHEESGVGLGVATP